MSTYSRFVTKLFHVLVAATILLTSVPVPSVGVMAQSPDDDGAPPELEGQERTPPGLRLYAIVEPPVVAPGEEAVCTVTVVNEDVADATDLTLSARLPGGLAPADESGPRWEAFIADLAMGEAAEVELPLQVNDLPGQSLAFAIELRDAQGEVRATTTAIVGVARPEKAQRIDATGGRFAGEDGRVRVDFPPGALHAAVDVTARVQAQGIDPRARAEGRQDEGMERNGVLLRFALEAEDAATGKAVERFDQPVTLEVDLRGLLDEGGLLAGQHVFLSHVVDPATGEGDVVDATYDPQTGLLTAQLDHFSDWETGVAGEGWEPTVTLPVTDLFSGSATYHYPIRVPAGRNGLQPNVTISYNSRRLDGLLGGTGKLDSAPLPLGWSVGGIPEIVRSSKFEDGKFYLKNHFTLVLNGTSHKLKPASATQTCGRYWVEDAPGIYVERRNDSGGSCTDTSATNETKDYWIVRTPDGTKYRLGYLENSEVHVWSGDEEIVCTGYCSSDSDRLGAIRWRVDAVTGTFTGNRMEFTYRWKMIEVTDRIDVERSSPKVIQYNRYAPGVYRTQVKFVFDSDEESTSDYMRVVAIEVKDNEETIRRYEFTTGKKTWNACNKVYKQYLAT
jgi:hypothetical protein